MVKAKKEKEKGEQLDLIDVAPKNAKPIIAEARLYKRYQRARMLNGEKERASKEIIKDLVHKAELQPLEDGSVRFSYDGMTVTVTPRDELVQVTEE